MNSQRDSRSVILCIDDQATALELEIRKRMLERAGYRVLTAKSAHEALEIFRENHVDLILTEQLARVFTLAAIRMLKPEVPIAVYSAYWEASPEYMRLADAFITKLVPTDELLCEIECLLATPSTVAVA